MILLIFDNVFTYQNICVRIFAFNTRLMSFYGFGLGESELGGQELRFLMVWSSICRLPLHESLPSKQRTYI